MDLLGLPLIFLCYMKMFKCFFILYFSIICFFTSLGVQAETSLWQVESGASVMYIGGTCHILRQSDYPLPAEFESAYKKSDIIVFETDIDKLSSIEAQQLLLAKGMYADGTTLDMVLSAEAYSALEKYCDKNGFPLAIFNQFKPPMVMLTLLGFELQKLGVNQSGVDVYFYEKAKADGKTIKALESVEEQIEMMTGMADGNENNFIFYTIKDLENTADAIDSMIDAWKTANIEELNEICIMEMKAKFPKLYKSLFIERNIKWLSKIKNYLNTQQKEFLLVGVGHLVGEDGIIEQLKNLGFRVQKYSY
ncbi:MAG: TraB/GumN family protein [Candidatus Omnitrophota bacterium]